MLVLETEGDALSRVGRSLARTGVAPLKLPARYLMRLRPVNTLAEQALHEAEERAVITNKESLLSLIVAALLVVTLVVWLVTGSLVCGVACALCLAVVGAGSLKAREEKRVLALRDEIPDALRSIGVCFRTGFSLTQTLAQTGTEMKGPLGALFTSAARVLETGGNAQEALAVFRRYEAVPELSFVAVALDVQHKAGGSLGPVLEAARESVEGEIDLARSLKVQTAQAKLSARIVTVMPFILIALFSFMSPGFLNPFFESVAGLALLSLALLMQAAGVIAVNRLLNKGEVV
jgi:tight adherence protein B